MSGEFDIFDEWGNYVGKFSPADGGGWFSFALLLLLVAGFLVYMVVKLVVNGFKAAVAGKWGKALAYWALPLFLVLIGPISNASDTARFESLCTGTRVEVSGTEILVYPEEGYHKAYDVMLRVNGSEEEIDVLINMARMGNDATWEGPIREVVLTRIWEYMGSPLETRSVSCDRVVYP